jgi:flagellar hook assembly protein FlgD
MYPNPTNSSLTLEFLYDVNKNAVQITIIDILGREVKTVDIPLMGKYKNTWVWDGLDDFKRELPTGIYILTLTSGQTIESRKITLLK